MVQRIVGIASIAIACASAAAGGEKQFVSLRGYCEAEMQSAGFELRQPATIRIKALGAGGEKRWSGKDDQMSAYGWIINADTRETVWRMEMRNTERSRDDRAFDGTVALQPGAYEAYFTAYGFNSHSAFSSITVNIDHRKKPLFTEPAKKKNFFTWFGDWFTRDMGKEWRERCRGWGMDLSIDEGAVRGVRLFQAPRPFPRAILRIAAAGDGVFLRKQITVTIPQTVEVYALGERSNSGEFADQAWITRVRDHARVWEMEDHDRRAGGAEKNVRAAGRLALEKGEYVVTYVTDDSHSPADWNSAPPDDPLNYGITLSATDDRAAKGITISDVAGFSNVIVSLVRVGDDEERSEGFTLKQEAAVRIYAIGERSNDHEQMADYGIIVDAKSRARVWTMNPDETEHAGGGSKNRMIDETVTLPRGSYLVMYRTDDSHAYGDWNDDPPYDQEHYGITVMGTGERYSPSVVGKYVEERDRDMIAQITRAGDSEDRSETFLLPRTTRVRIYAIGEGQNREMYDYGWIEEVKSGTTVWEMTYGMTFHAGGGRKNRLVNTTMILEKGEYRLHWQSDDSHSYRDWNVDPPEDEAYWGITVYRDETPAPPEIAPHPGLPGPPDVPPPPGKTKPPKVQKRIRPSEAPPPPEPAEAPEPER